MPARSFTLALLAAGMVTMAPVLMAGGGVLANPSAPAGTQEGNPTLRADRVALEQCKAKVKADREKIEQDRSQWRQLHERGAKPDSQQVQSLKAQYHQDMETLKQDHNSCKQVREKFRQDRNNIQNDQTPHP